MAVPAWTAEAHALVGGTLTDTLLLGYGHLPEECLGEAVGALADFLETS